MSACHSTPRGQRAGSALEQRLWKTKAVSQLKVNRLCSAEAEGRGGGIDTGNGCRENSEAACRSAGRTPIGERAGPRGRRGDGDGAAG
ncbi:hypothetical protein EYF80_001378 [Liparis tanakae]|uniref:Uncharacterized protein n=1 Tax=Liparis tanakae TaxID=230148 RepID=A0A4Z2JE88_9TELE|nr:hypothetical protein EYF80_001378 [Liparis tanakae]